MSVFAVPVLLLALAADPSFEEAERAAIALPHPAALATMERWIASHADSPDLPRAYLWEAQLLGDDGKLDDAMAMLEKIDRLPHPGDWRFDAGLMRGDLLFLRRHYTASAEAFEAIHAPPDSRWDYTAKIRAADARGEALREKGVWATSAALLALVVYRGLRGRKHLWPPPEEALYAAPLLAMMGIAGAFREAEERAAVIEIALGGLLLLWANGAYFKARAPRGVRRLAEGLFGVVQMLGLLFVSIVTAGLWAEVINTFASGVE